MLNLTLEWKPLEGLTAEMVEWMFGNLHKTALSPFDNKTYPMYGKCTVCQLQIPCLAL